MKNIRAHQFNSITEIELPANLKEAVLARISRAKAIKLRNQKIFFALSFSLTGGLFIAATIIFGSQLLGSDFWSLGSLCFTDLSTLLGHWQDYGNSLLETFPAMSVAGILAPVFIFMMLLKQYAKQQRVGSLKLRVV